HKPLGNLAVGEPLTNQRRNLALSRRQLERSLNNLGVGGYADHASYRLARRPRVPDPLVPTPLVALHPGSCPRFLGHRVAGGRQPALNPSTLAVLDDETSLLSQPIRGRGKVQGAG